FDRLHQSGDDAQERTLAAPGGAEHAEEFVARDRDLEVLERTHPAVLPLIGVVDAIRLDDEVRQRDWARSGRGRSRTHGATPDLVPSHGTLFHCKRTVVRV